MSEAETGTRECITLIEIRAALAPRINLAYHQNSVPVLRELSVSNPFGATLNDVVVSLHSEPAFLVPRSWRIDRIAAVSRYHITERDIGLDGTHLARLTEAETIQAVFVLTVGGEERTRLTLPLELLPRNHWSGAAQVPEMVSAFVQPNDPSVDRILKRASEVLHRNGRSGAINGYADRPTGCERSPKRAWELASSIWTAIGGLGLTYALPPASFERTGQKVRSPTQILDGGVATCLDTALLFAGCLEQAGLNTVIVFTHGHALTGVWLKKEEFTTAVVDDITALRKRVKLRELVLFETTLATHRPCPSFARAAEQGADQIAEAEEDKFELAVDIRRCRMERLRPLANAEVAALQTPVEPETAAVEPTFEPAPDLPDDDGAGDEAPSTPQGRLDRWQRKLLDLSLRNSLLNFKAGKRAIRIEAPDPGRLEDLLAEEKKLRILSRPDLMDGADPRNHHIHEVRHHEDARRELILEALERGQILVRLEPDELDGRLVDLFRSARATLQEGGANTLFIALGFLSWIRDDRADKCYKAPLILLPVSLERKSVRSGFSLLLHEDEPRFNPTLLEMLRQDFQLSLPIAEGELPKDDSGLNVKAIWQSVQAAVKDIRGWEVTEEVVLSTFSFAKYLMWKDLVDRTDQLKQNRVVRHLIDTPRDPYVSDVSFPDPQALDRDHGPEATFCPLPADSSQLSAIMAAAKGKDFVLVGPPGTGKSQTIANLIAQCLAEKKTVLFVSEKIAALDVVYRRLRNVGLGEFCLELHSSKARKLDVLEQLRKAWDAKGDMDADAWRQEARRLKTLRDQLNGYVERLHCRRRNGLRVHAAIGTVVAGRGRPDIGLSWPSADAHDAAALDTIREVVDRLDVNLRGIGHLDGHPLAPVARGEWSSSWQQSLVTAAAAAILVAEEVQEAATAFLTSVGLPNMEPDARRRQALTDLSHVLPDAWGRDWRFVLRPDTRSITDRLKRGLTLLERHRAMRDSLSPPWPADRVRDLQVGCTLVAEHRDIAANLSGTYVRDALAKLDTPVLSADWEKAETAFWPFGWLRQRKISKILATAGEKQSKAALANDLTLLARMRQLEERINALDHLKSQDGVSWVGLETDIAVAEAALRLQAAIPAAIRSDPWSDEGLAPVDEEKCGATAAKNLATMRAMAALEREIAELDDLAPITAGLWAGLRTRIEEVEAALRFGDALSSAISGLATTADELVAIRPSIERLLGDANALLDAAGPIAGAGKTWRDALAAFEDQQTKLLALAGRGEADALTAFGVTPAAVVSTCRALVAAAPRLNAWCAWRKARDDASILGLGPLIEAIESGTIPDGKIRDVFEVSYARWWLNTTVDGDDILRRFVSAEHEKRIADFRAQDDRFVDLTRAFIRASLCGNLPDQADVSRNSEWGLLKREVEKKKRHIPMRELIQGLPSALKRLTPCLLMSPLSIAQYLGTETAQFDVVVFDEASQIPVWDAVGAIARGRQVIMVGDPKQLPPTSFFNRAETDEDESETEQDMESILDECLAANLPTQNLSWHYRSRHESLIAFSNHRYYGGGLITFPSPVTEDRAVSFHHVPDGVYERGRARVNQREARALVSDLVSRLKDPDFLAAGLSVGVVTFNAEQQKLIEDLLDAERRKDPEIEYHFAEERLEPVFVKNLENVQGDERDIMYFSITYGPHELGVPPSMNFGPMNRDGGQRRLNVAVTRARYELRVFSSLTPEEIDLSRTQAEGVRDLKHFMEFAERGPRALAEAVFGSIGTYDSPFEKAVAEALTTRGWQVHPQIGVSRFRIDLGIVDPDLPGRYLAGLECDGATYHRSATARDRDKLREMVLRNLGWKIVRIWSTDWWLDPATALEKTDAALRALLDQARSERAVEAAKVAERAAAEAAVQDQEGRSDDQDAEVAEAKSNVGFAEPADEWEAGPSAPASDRIVTGSAGGEASALRKADDLFAEADFALSAAAGISNITQAVQPTRSWPDVFHEARIDIPTDPESFFDATYDSTLITMIRAVVEAEGPLRDDVLCRRIARAHGWTRTGPKIMDRLLTLAYEVCHGAQEDDHRFFWPSTVEPSSWQRFRRSVGKEPRPVDEISMAELEALARELLADGVDGDDALTAMARIAGLQRLRAASRARLQDALARATATR